MSDDGRATGMARVVLAEDDVLLREGLASLLERSGFQVVGQAGDGAQLLTLVRGRRPDLVVVDIRMPPSHTAEGLEAARVIREELPDTGILVLSAHVDVDHAVQSGRVGSGRIGSGQEKVRARLCVAEAFDACCSARCGSSRLTCSVGCLDRLSPLGVVG
jgi:DNA-binding NarL/FixJ family response regulator